jgi:hypothetical protein
MVATLPGLTDACGEARIGADLPTVGEPFWLPEFAHDQQSREEANPVEASQSFDLREPRGHALESIVEAGELGLEVLHASKKLVLKNIAGHPEILATDPRETPFA